MVMGSRTYAVSAPTYPPFGSALGEIRVYSGRTGSQLAAVPGDRAFARFGECFREVGDLDADGVTDFVAGSPMLDTPNGTRSGRIAAVSGATGNVLWSRPGFGALAELGRFLDVIADLDGDGIADVVALEPRYGSFAVVHGRVLFLSGLTGQLLGTADGPPTFGDRIGNAVAGHRQSGAVFVASDLGTIYRVTPPVLGVAQLVLVDAPASPGAATLALVRAPQGGFDLIVGRAGESTGGFQRNGTVRLLTGSSSTLLFEGSRDFEAVGSAVSAVLDFDGDGTDEIGFSSAVPNGPFGLGRMRVVTRTGDLREDESGIVGTSDDLGSLPDVTGDGRGEWFTSSSQSARFRMFTSGLRRASLSTTSGVQATFAIEGSGVLAGRAYVQLFSLSGQVPGFPGAGTRPHVPLTPDAMTETALQLAGTPFFVSTIGVLDASGGGVSGFALPASITAFLVGQELSTVVLVADPAGTSLAAVTNPRAVRFP